MQCAAVDGSHRAEYLRGQRKAKAGPLRTDQAPRQAETPTATVGWRGIVCFALAATTLTFTAATAGAAKAPLHPCGLASEAEATSVFAPVKLVKTGGFGGWYWCSYYMYSSQLTGGTDILSVEEWHNPCKKVFSQFGYFDNLSWYFGNLSRSLRYSLHLHQVDKALRAAHLRRVPTFPTIAWQGDGIEGSGVGPLHLL